MGSKELAAQLNDLAAQLGAKVVPAEGGGWGAAAPAASSLPFIGVSVPIKLETPIGSVKVFLSLPPEVASNPGTLMAAIQQLVQMGLPVDAYQPKENGWGRNGGGGYGGGGYGGGGYGRREFGGNQFRNGNGFGRW